MDLGGLRDVSAPKAPEAFVSGQLSDATPHAHALGQKTPGGAAFAPLPLVPCPRPDPSLKPVSSYLIMPWNASCGLNGQWAQRAGCGMLACDHKAPRSSLSEARDASQIRAVMVGVRGG